jgi:sporulation protein YlmC with PRC-barrel domain
MKMLITVSCLMLGLSSPVLSRAQEKSPEKCDSSLRKAEADFVGKTIKGQDGATLGKVEDLMADLEGGRITYAVVSLKNATGKDDRYYVLPWGTLVRGTLDDHVLVTLPTERLTKCQGFDKNNWPSMTDAKWCEEAYRCCDQKPYWATTRVETVPRVMRVSKIVGMDVRNPQNENLGDVDELVIDTADGKIVYAVISFGGFLGMGDKLFAMPSNSLDLSSTGDKLVLNVDKERLKSAPGFDKNNWPDMASAAWITQIRTFYGDGSKPSARNVARLETKVLSGPVATCVKSKDLIGSKVKNAQGEDLGKVEEIVLDLEEGQIAYAVLSFGGFLGMGDKLFAIPAETLKRRASDNAIVLDVDKDRLKKAPGFDKNNWPSLSDRAWLVSVYEYYGLPPYWTPPPSPTDR